MFEVNKGLQNKDKDLTEQRSSQYFAPGLVGVSTLIQLGVISSSQTIVAVQSAAFGLSSAPTVGLQIQRFLVGVGNTVIALNGSSLLTISAYSTSGAQSHVFPASCTLLPNDVLQAVTSTASSAATYHFGVVTQVLAAVRADYGV